MKITVVSFCIFILLCVASGLTINDWKYSQKITVRGVQSLLINETVLVVVNTKTLVSQGFMKDNAADIRFVDAYTSKEFPYFLYSKFNTEKTEIFVRLDVVPPTSTFTILLIYGNKNADFPFYENFVTAISTLPTSFSGLVAADIIEIDPQTYVKPQERGWLELRGLIVRIKGALDVSSLSNRFPRQQGSGCDGSYGGIGYCSPGPIYGTPSGIDISHGSSGTYGQGGGVLTIFASIIEIETGAALTANSVDTGQSGSGSGGGILLVATERIRISGALIEANGALNTYYNYRQGGSGRIKIFSNDINVDSSTTIRTWGAIERSDTIWKGSIPEEYYSSTNGKPTAITDGTTTSITTSTTTSTSTVTSDPSLSSESVRLVPSFIALLLLLNIVANY